MKYIKRFLIILYCVACFLGACYADGTVNNKPETEVAVTP